jgi:predicted  nucleic acid-binding Zn-ribbon protein
MKRVWGSMVIAVLVIALALSFAACGNANASKLEELDGLVSQYEGVVADAQAQVDVLTGYVQQYEIEGFDEIYNKIVAQMEELSAQKDDIVGTYNENKDSYTAEKLDELIGILNTQIESVNTYVTNLKDTVSKFEESINGAQE